MIAKSRGVASTSALRRRVLVRSSKAGLRASGSQITSINISRAFDQLRNRQSANWPGASHSCGRATLCWFSSNGSTVSLENTLRTTEIVMTRKTCVCFPAAPAVLDKRLKLFVRPPYLARRLNSTLLEISQLPILPSMCQSIAMLSSSLELGRAMPSDVLFIWQKASSSSYRLHMC